MSHIVPDWDLHDPSVPARFDIYPQHSSSTLPTTYEMEELTWENGQLLTQGLWPRAAVETLEAIVDQATQKKQGSHVSNSVDALVPCGTHNEEGHQRNGDDDQAVHVPPRSTCVVEYNTRVEGSSRCSTVKKARIETRVPVEGERSFQQNQQQSGGDSISRHVPTVDTCEKDSAGFGLETTSFCSRGRSFSSSDKPSSTNNTTTVDSVCLTRQQEVGSEEEKKKGSAKSSSSTKRSRAAATHNQSERKRRESINQKLKTLQKLVPNANKTDKASMLDEVIDHMKGLQAQLQMMAMSRMSMPSMMPFAMSQHPIHMPIMSPMGMGMAGMDMNIINPIMAGQNLATMPPTVVNPNATFMPMAPPSDPSAYLAHFQPQPMTKEAYSQMVAQIQLQQQQMASISKT